MTPDGGQKLPDAAGGGPDTSTPAPEDSGAPDAPADAPIADPDAGSLAVTVLGSGAATTPSNGIGGGWSTAAPVAGRTILIAVLGNVAPTTVKVTGDAPLTKVQESSTGISVSLWRLPKNTTATSVNSFSVDWPASQVFTGAIVFSVPGELGDAFGAVSAAAENGAPTTASLTGTGRSFFVGAVAVQGTEPIVVGDPASPFLRVFDVGNGGARLAVAHRLTSAGAPAQSVRWTPQGVTKWDAVLVGYPAP